MSKVSTILDIILTHFESNVNITALNLIVNNVEVILSNWGICLMIFLVFLTVRQQTLKFAINNAKSDSGRTILMQLVAGISVLLFIPFFEFKLPSDPSVYILLTIACFFYALCDYLNVKIQKQIEVSEYTILAQLSTVFMVAIGILFMGDGFIRGKVIGAALVILGNFVTSYKKGRVQLDKYFFLGVVRSLAFAIAMCIDVDNSRQFNLPLYISFTLIVPAIIIAVVSRTGIKTIVSEAKLANKLAVLISGVSWSTFIIFQITAYQLGTVSTIVPLESSLVLVNIVVAYFLHKEKDNLRQKIFAGIFVIIGVVLVALNSKY